MNLLFSSLYARLKIHIHKYTHFDVNTEPFVSRLGTGSNSFRILKRQQQNIIDKYTEASNCLNNYLPPFCKTPELTIQSRSS